MGEKIQRGLMLVLLSFNTSIFFARNLRVLKLEYLLQEEIVQQSSRKASIKQKTNRRNSQRTQNRMIIVVFITTNVRFKEARH